MLKAVHEVFDVTVALVLPPDTGVLHDVGDTMSVRAACVTVMVLVIPPPTTVIVPVLLVVPVFAVTVSVNVPLPVPLEGETVSHVS